MDNMEVTKILCGAYAEAWDKLDASIIFPYLDGIFTYSSFWVFSTLDLAGYKEYLVGKFATIKKTGGKPIVELLPNPHPTLGTGIKLTQNDNETFLCIECDYEKKLIKSAYMMPFYF